MNSIKKRVSYLLAMVFVILALTGCTSKTAIVGQWRQQGQSDILLEAYDDGTCVISGEYGLGTWELSSGNRLRLSNIYGETQVFSIKKLTNSKMIIDRDRADLYWLACQIEAEEKIQPVSDADAAWQNCTGQQSSTRSYDSCFPEAVPDLRKYGGRRA